MTETNTLERIAAATRLRIAAAKQMVPLAELRARAIAARTPLDFTAPFRGAAWGVIAEVKLASPSEGDIGLGLDPVAVAREYAANGAFAISVLTEPDFFKGSLDFLAAIRKAVEIPLLMKDFVLEEYQLYQARANGADAVLLIAALLGEDGLARLFPAAAALGLTALIEVHDEPELRWALKSGGRLIGVNNRDLKTLKTDLNVSRRLAATARVPGVTLVCESGLRARGEIEELAGLGYRGFLIGTHFIKSGRPGVALAELL